MSHIGKNIKLRREELGMSQEELAQKLGYKSKSTVNKVELGINDITQSKIVKYAKALKTSPSKLMGWDNEKTYAVYYNKTESIPLEMNSNSSEAIRLMAYFESLTDEGKKRALDNIFDLTQIPAYKKKEDISMAAESPMKYNVNAAHEIKDATEEEKQQDEDLMADEENWK